MRTRTKWLLGITALLVVIVTGAGVYLTPIAPIATGYAVKNACSVTFVAGRDPASAGDDLPANPLVPLLRTSIDRDQGHVRTTVLGLWGTDAWFTNGLGCTIADQRPDLDPIAQPDPAGGDEPWPQGAAIGPIPDGIDTAAIETAFDAQFAEDDPEDRAKNTRAVVVVKDGRLVAERHADDFGPDVPQLGWSMGKTVAAGIAGRLALDGEVRRTDDALRSEWAGGDRSAITLEHLLTMTDGLDWTESYAPGSGDVTSMLFRPRDTGAFAAAKPLAHDPGSYLTYSSGTSNILCDVLHDASGRGAGMARDLVFDPLGMTSAVMEPDEAGDLVCSSYVWASPRDWARFGQWWLQDGEWDGEQLLPDDWVSFATTAVDADGRETPYGGQIHLNTGVDGEQVMPRIPGDAYWASGHDGQRVVVIPSKDLVVVRTGFTPDLTWEELGFEDLLADVMAATDGA